MVVFGRENACRLINFVVITERFIRSRASLAGMANTLEARISGGDGFKSAGERKVAEVFDKYGISYKYESPVLVHDDQNKPRIWYPDFYLPTLGVYVEYYGFTGNPDYDTLRKKKEQVYQNMGFQVVAVDPSVLHDKLDGYLINEIYRVQRMRCNQIKSRVYGLRTGQRTRYR
jgi:hypothetical protein